ncbi:MAG: hypothetical protein WKF77_13860 [Planctomycetaceae bacterium]
MTRVTVAVGPGLPEFGSWNWLGAGLVEALRPEVEAISFKDLQNPPAANVIVFLKFAPPAEILAKLRRSNCRLVYIPVDIYGSASEIEGDVEFLRSFDLVVVHCRRLLRYFTAARRAEYLDHPLKYILSDRRTGWQPGPMLWVGRRCNIGPIVAWANQRTLEADLWILTETDGRAMRPQEFGFDNPDRVRAGTWTEATHLEWLAQVSTAIDVKGSDFRSRHKPRQNCLISLPRAFPFSSIADHRLTWNCTIEV